MRIWKKVLKLFISYFVKFINKKTISKVGWVTCYSSTKQARWFYKLTNCIDDKQLRRLDDLSISVSHLHASIIYLDRHVFPLLRC